MKISVTLLVISILIFGYGLTTADEIILPESADKRVMIPQEDLGNTWRSSIGYSDATWALCSGAPGGVGYEQNSGYENLISLDVGPYMHESAANPNSSCYLRIKFEMTDDMIERIDRLNLNVRYDDGFIAWLNGVEVARMNADGAITWNSEATGSHDSNGQEIFNISDFKDRLRTGVNLLAIQALNNGAGSSDFLINVELVSVEDPFSNFTHSNLPLIFIDTNGQNIRDEPKITATMRIVYHGIGNTHYIDEPANDYDGPIGIEWRGSSSQSWPKKQYAVETRDENGDNNNVSLMGLPEENDWVLNAPFLDRSFMRNVLAYDLSRRLGNYASRTRYCELFLNGEYQGIYILMEKIKRDKDRVDIARLDSAITGDDVTGGYILKIDKNEGAGNDGFTSEHLPAGESTRRIVYQYHYPDPADLLPQQKTYIRNYMADFEDMMASNNYNDPQTGYPAWIDVESFIDFFLVSEIGKNVDSYRLSSYLFKERDSDGGLLHAGPIWDYNLAFGLANYYDGEDTDGWMVETLLYMGGGDWQVPFWWATLLDDPQFNYLIKPRWFSLRKSVFSVERIHAFIDNIAYDLRDAQARNFTLWPAPGERGTGFWPMPGLFYNFTSYQDEVDYMKWWIEERVKWMDENIMLFSGIDEDKIGTLQPDEFVLFQNYPNPFNPSTTIAYELPAPAHISLTIYNSAGQIVRAVHQQQPAGQYHFVWDGKNDAGQPVAGGVYLYKVDFQHANNTISKTQKMLLLK